MTPSPPIRSVHLTAPDRERRIQEVGSLVDERDAGRAADLEPDDLYSSPTGPDLDADLKRAAPDAEAFAKDYEGKVAALDGKALGGAVARFEALSDLMGRIGSYAQLYYAQNMADPERGRFSQNVSEALTDIGTKLVFFRLELNKLEDADLAAKLKDPGARQVRAVAARPARLPPAPALRRAREGCCTRSTSSAAPPGRACSTRPSRGCAIPSATRC